MNAEGTRRQIHSFSPQRYESRHIPTRNHGRRYAQSKLPGEADIAAYRDSHVKLGTLADLTEPETQRVIQSPALGSPCLGRTVSKGGSRKYNRATVRYSSATVRCTGLFSSANTTARSARSVIMEMERDREGIRLLQQRHSVDSSRHDASFRRRPCRLWSSSHGMIHRMAVAAM
jgi:hypothetical protein